MKIHLFIIAFLLNQVNAQSLSNKNGTLFGMLRGDGILVPIAKYDEMGWSNILGKNDLWDPSEGKYLCYYYDSVNVSHKLKVSTIVAFEPGLNHEGTGMLSSYTEVNGFNPTGFYAIAFASTNSVIKPLMFKSGLGYQRSVPNKFAHIIDSAFLSQEKLYVLNMSKKSNLDKNVLSYINAKQNSKPVYNQYQMLRDTINDIEIVRFGLEKEYLPKDCPMIGMMSGWVIVRNSNVLLANINYELDDCDGKMFSNSFSPYTFFNFNDEYLILTAVIQYEGDTYQLLKLNKSSVTQLLNDNK